MIWYRGAIIDPSELSISCLDRTFEHGQGLFETFRTWGGRTRTLPRHLRRLQYSARVLGLPLDPRDLPDEAEVIDLLAAEGLRDGLIRIVLTGGLDSPLSSVLWMRASPLPPPFPSPLRVRATWRIGEPNPVAAFKTLNYWRNRIIHDRAREEGFDEDLGRDPAGHFVEGTRSNLFCHFDGLLVATIGTGHSLPGITRRIVLQRARHLNPNLKPSRDQLNSDALLEAEEIFLTNAGRGIMPVGTVVVDGQTWQRPAPGPVTRRLSEALVAWLESEERP